jgi:hypothetical protein
VANIGLSAPLIIKALAGIIPVPIPPAPNPAAVGPAAQLPGGTVRLPGSATPGVSLSSVVNFLAGR